MLSSLGMGAVDCQSRSPWRCRAEPTRYYTCEQQQFSVLLKAALSMQHPSKCTEQLFVLDLSRNVPRGGSKSDPCKIGEKIVLFHEQVWIFLVNNHLQIIKFFNYSSVLNRSHMDTIWNFDPNYSLPNLTQVSQPKMFQIVATWLQFSTEEYDKYMPSSDVKDLP